jgi:NAD(P)-dependent dehydrogenase (short-subunit alcohol dehydrogenase family)
MTIHLGTVDLSGRKALVTGGASGIGEATAQLLVQLGATVAIADRNSERIPMAVEGTRAAIGIVGDVTNEQDVDRMVGDTVEKLGGLDIVCNCAGIGDDLVPLHDQTTDRWREVLDCNLWGTYLVCRAAGKHMLEARRGAIVNVSSIVGLDGFPGRSAYGVAKAGVIHLTKTLACEWGPSGVRVNAIAPSYTLTPMVASLLERRVFDPAVLERRTPLQRMALPLEVARAAAFLLSDWASYVTGVLLPVDGGWSAYGAAGDVAVLPASSLRS